MKPFWINVPDAKLAWIRDRVASYPWASISDAGGWSSGVSLDLMKDLADYWTSSFDWRSAEAALNRFPQYIAHIDGVDLHFHVLRSPEPSARPLLLLHGWPGSVFEFHHVMETLADPRANSADPADAFHVIVPSLPGYGFSGKPTRPTGPARIAQIMVKLMTETLGFSSYFCQGGDWGAIISTLIGHFDGKRCEGIHLNMLLPDFAQRAASEDERCWVANFAEKQRLEGAYGQLQMTKPQSLGVAMSDSPLGIAAWIVEKFAGWSDLPRAADGAPDLRARYTFDQLLTNIMIYLAQDSFVTSTWLYKGFANELPGLPMVRGERCATPTGVAAFPDPIFPPPPRSLAMHYYNVVHWTDMPRGGHFAALEAPDLFVEDVRLFARSIR